MHKTMLGHFSSDQTYIARGKFWFETEKLLTDPTAEPRIIMLAYCSDALVPISLEIDINHNRITWAASGLNANISNKFEIIEYVKQLIAKISQNQAA